MPTFEENKHPRDIDGKFATKGNEASKSSHNRQEELENKYNSELPSKPNKSFVKACKSLSKQIEIHSDKIKNPKKYILDWDNKPEMYKKGIIKYWEKEIINFKNQIDKLGK